MITLSITDLEKLSTEKLLATSNYFKELANNVSTGVTKIEPLLTADDLVSVIETANCPSEVSKLPHSSEPLFEVHEETKKRGRKPKIRSIEEAVPLPSSELVIPAPEFYEPEVNLETFDTLMPKISKAISNNLISYEDVKSALIRSTGLSELIMLSSHPEKVKKFSEEIDRIMKEESQDD